LVVELVVTLVQAMVFLVVLVAEAVAQMAEAQQVLAVLVHQVKVTLAVQVQLLTLHHLVAEAVVQELQVVMA
jgi:hypothetical protein